VAPYEVESTGVTTNYAGNYGIWLVSHGSNGFFRHLESAGSLFGKAGVLRASDVTDGLSNTAAVAELLHSDGGYHRLRVNWQTPRGYDSATQLDAFTALCESLPPAPADFGWRGNPLARGLPWTQGQLGITMYNHASPPNQPSCLNQGSYPSAISEASSNHRGGVNLLFADGHLSFAANDVDRKVWRSHGSRGEGD
jgi:prepilin-type processing-associated H-X9-DG protein